MSRGSLRKAAFSVWGYIGFFAATAFVAACSILLYAAVRARYESDTAVALLCLGNILFLALVCTLIDFLRRKMFVERPVRRILDATRAIAAGDFTVRLTPAHAWGKYDEFDAIMENLNRMAADLASTEMLRTDFVANVSHEIKTPLSVICNYASALQDEALPADERRAYAQTLAKASQRLARLVSDILALGRLENRSQCAKNERVDLSEALRGGVIALERLFDEKEISLDCTIEDVTVCTDVHLWEIVWNNLLSNAIKFTPSGGRVCVSLLPWEGGAELTVRDTGCGMSAETCAHAFDKFYQGDTSHAQEGNGLGLALVKQVVDILGGEIAVQSEPGKGSAFTVRLRGE